MHRPLSVLEINMEHRFLYFIEYLVIFSLIFLIYWIIGLIINLTLKLEIRTNKGHIACVVIALFIKKSPQITPLLLN